MYMRRFTDTYTNGTGPRLITGGVAGAYSGWPNPQEIAESCGYPMGGDQIPEGAPWGGLVLVVLLIVVINVMLSDGEGKGR